MISERDSLQNAADNWKREAERVAMVALTRQAEIERLLAALIVAEHADHFHVNCQECESEGAPEECEKCFPLADNARLMRRAALAPYPTLPPADTEPATQEDKS